MKGLSFSEPMVKAWMEGRKTVTRRLVKVDPRFSAKASHVERTIGWFDFEAPPNGNRKHGDRDRIKAKYLPGETVYIKETWAEATDFGYATDHIFYKASYINGGPFDDVKKWKSPRFMPEWASRSHARIVSVRPERVQEITEDEAKREGVSAMFVPLLPSFTAGFISIWHTLHPGSWERNDWVWRIQLEKKQ